jgi:hypothetical protein
MATSPTDLDSGPLQASLFLSAWVKARSEDKARKVVGRAVGRARIPVTFESVGFDDSRELWKLAGVIALPASAPDGAWTALRILTRLARSVSVFGPVELDGGGWSVDGYAVEAELTEPGLSFLDFSARSSS